MKNHTLLVSLVIFALIASGCATASTPTSQPSPTLSPEPLAVEDTASLKAALEAAGAAVEMGDPISQEFFRPEGNILKVNGADVQVFEYESAEAMENEASQVAPDGGSVGTSMMMWVDTPHFYKTGRILVLYIGSDEIVLSLLDQVLGPQFAGR
jgi:hypothetical protein